ncbi:MAG: hypothetical protein ACRBBS_18390, partial [Thalassovita sp.]
GDGNDTLEGSGDRFVLRGGEGDDLLISDSEDNAIYGGPGNDTIQADNLRVGDYYGEDGDDTFDLVFNDTYYRHDMDETIRGGAGDDVFRITNLSYHSDGFILENDGEPETYHFWVRGDEGADTFEVTHQFDRNYSSSHEPDFFTTNSTWIADFDPDEDILIINPNESGSYNGTPTMSIETTGPHGPDDDVYRNAIELVYTQETTGVQATWRLDVAATRPLTTDDIVLNLAG